MNAHHNWVRGSRDSDLVDASGLCGDRNISTQEMAGRDLANSHDCRGVDGRDFLVEPFPAVLELCNVRISIIRGATPDTICDPYVLAIKPYVLEHVIEKLATSTYKGFAHLVLLCTWSLTQNEQICIGRSNAVDNERSGLDQIGTACTRRHTMIRFVHIKGWIVGVLATPIPSIGRPGQELGRTNWLRTTPVDSEGLEKGTEIDIRWVCLPDEDLFAINSHSLSRRKRPITLEAPSCLLAVEMFTDCCLEAVARFKR